MNHICANIMGHLNQRGFYSVLQVCDPMPYRGTLFFPTCTWIFTTDFFGLSGAFPTETFSQEEFKAWHPVPSPVRFVSGEDSGPGIPLLCSIFGSRNNPVT